MDMVSDSEIPEEIVNMVEDARKRHRKSNREYAARKRLENKFKDDTIAALRQQKRQLQDNVHYLQGQLRTAEAEVAELRALLNPEPRRSKRNKI